MKIPNRIIQTGKTSALPPSAKASATNLKLLHPDWEYLYFDDQDIRRFIASDFPEYQTVFDAFPRTIQRIDFFRYLAVYRLGGFYFDLDVFLSESLSPLLQEACVFPFEELTFNRHLRRHGFDWEIGNYAFGSAAGHPFLGAAIENCVRAQREPDWVGPMMGGIPSIFRSDFEVLYTTGPGLLTRTLAENPVVSADMTVLFPKDVRDENSWHLFGDYGVHIMEGSWRSQGGYLHRRLRDRWEAWTLKRSLAASRSLGPTRSFPRVKGGAGHPVPPISPESELACK